jgi:hypothetical protein
MVNGEFMANYMVNISQLGGFFGCSPMAVPSGNLTVCELEHDPIERVDVPIDSIVIFQFANC